MQMFVHFIFLASLQIFTSVIFATANGTYTLRYDANGNLIKRESTQNGQSRQLIWDEENRLACTRDNQQGYLPQTPDSCKAQGNSNAPTFTYDAAGVRVAKNSGALSLTINQHYSEKQNNGYKHIFVGTQRLTTKLVVGNTKKLEDAQWYYSGDHLGSSSYLTDSNGQLQEYLSYTPFGETLVDEKPSMPIQFAFTGQELDSETGLYHFQHRYYDPRISTWISADAAIQNEFLPIREHMNKPWLDIAKSSQPQSGDLFGMKRAFNPDELSGMGGVYNGINLGLYTYAHHNPVRYSDPDGRFTLALLPAAAACGPAAPVCAAVLIGVTIYTGVQVGQAIGQEINKQRAMHAEGDSLPKIKENPGRTNPLSGEPGTISRTRIKEGNRAGARKQDRVYDKNGNPEKDIDYGHDHSPVAHVHDWKIPRGAKPNSAHRQPERPPKPNGIPKD